MRSVFEMLKQMVMAGLPRQAGRRLPDREREQGALVCCLLAEMGCSAVLCQAKKDQCWTSSTRCHQGKEGTFEPGVVKRAGTQAKKSRHPQVSLQPFVPGAALTAVLDALGYLAHPGPLQSSGYRAAPPLSLPFPGTQQSCPAGLSHLQSLALACTLV